MSVIKVPYTGLCPRCRKADFKEVPKNERKDPRYPILRCGQCGYFEEHFEATIDERKRVKKCECYAVIDSDNERMEIWREVCPDLRVPLKHPGLCKGTAAGEEILMYEGDPKRMSGFQRARLAELFAEKFNISEMHAFAELEKGHLPVRAENVTVVICQSHMRSTL